MSGNDAASDAPGDARVFSDAEVALALRRAAALQVEAAERAERTSARPREDDADGYRLAELTAAAQEAGIDPQFVRVALAELETGRETAVAVRPDEATERSITRWLGTARRSVSVSRVIDAPVDEVWSALTEVAEGDTCGLELHGSAGGHPTRGGVAMFKMVRMREMYMRRRMYTPLCYRMEQLEAWSLRATLRAVGDRTDVTLFVDLREGSVANRKWARITTWLLGSAGAGGAFGLGLLAGLTAAGAFAVVGAITAAAVVSSAWRSAYRRAVDKLAETLDAVFDEVERRLRRQALVEPPQ